MIMISLTSINIEIFSKSCRCCLSQNVPLQPLFDASLGEMLSSFVTFKLLPGDEYPQQICKRCILKLSSCFTFRHTVMTSHQILKDIIESSHSRVEQTNRGQEDFDFEDKSNVSKQKVIENNIDIKSEHIVIEANVTSTDIARNYVIKQENLVKENLDISNKDNIVNEASFTSSDIALNDVIKQEELGISHKDYIVNEISITNNSVVDQNYIYEHEIHVKENLDISNEDIVYEVNFTSSDIAQNDVIEQESLVKESLDISNVDIINEAGFTSADIDKIGETGQESIINENIAIRKQTDDNTNIPMQEECNDLYELNTEGVDNADSLLYEDEQPVDCDEKLNTKMATDAVEFGRTSSNELLIGREALKTGGYGDSTTQCKVCIKRKLPAYLHHNDGMRYLCTYCGKVFKWRTSLCRHVRLHKGNNLHTCKYCTKQFKTHHYLQTHLSVHTGVTYKCDKCNKKFTQKCSLTKHEMLHTNIKPYQCEHCVHSFRDKSTLLAHLRRHTGEKPYKCAQCPKMFMWKTSYKVHLGRHSRQKDETSSLRGTANDSLLKGSKKKPNLNLMFLCMLCDARFPTQALLKEHSESHSNDLNSSQSECKIIYIINK